MNQVYSLLFCEPDVTEGHAIGELGTGIPFLCRTS